MKIHLPYGKQELTCDIPESPLLVSRVDQLCAKGNGQAVVEEAMNNPIGSPSLEALAERRGAAFSSRDPLILRLWQRRIRLCSIRREH